MSDRATQLLIDKFYKENGRCCAGCDHWSWSDAVVGECEKSPIMTSEARISILDISGISLDVKVGKTMTPRDYKCGEFEDTYDWGKK